jgi:hypothetical protein
METITKVDPASLHDKELLAESDQFCIYAVGNDTYWLVQRHEGSPWTALSVSGDGLFRINALITDAARHLYRHLADRLSPAQSKP